MTFDLSRGLLPLNKCLSPRAQSQPGSEGALAQVSMDEAIKGGLRLPTFGVVYSNQEL